MKASKRSTTVSLTSGTSTSARSTTLERRTRPSATRRRSQSYAFHILNSRRMHRRQESADLTTSATSSTETLKQMTTRHLSVRVSWLHNVSRSARSSRHPSPTSNLSGHSPHHSTPLAMVVCSSLTQSHPRNQS